MARGDPDALQVAFGAAVRELRLRRQVSQERLAELADLHRTYLGGIERGERNVSLVNIDKIAGALAVDLVGLMTEVETQRAQRRGRNR